MKNRHYFMIIVFSLFISQFLVAGEHHHHGQPAGKNEVKAVSQKLSEESIYNSKADLLNSAGSVVQLQSLRGKPVVISMAYTTCAYACPMIIAEMQALEKELNKKSKNEVQFVIVSFDPLKDTPAVIKAYAEKRKLGANWHLFTAKDDRSPREIANLLDIKYKKMEGGLDYDHSFLIAVLSPEGVILGKQVGANKDPKELLKLFP